jgi:acetyl-CoA acetyltransferase
VTIKEIMERERWETEEFFVKGSINVFDETEVFDKDAVFHIPPFPDIKGVEGFKQHCMVAHQLLTDIRWNWDEVIIEGNTAVQRFTMRGKHTGTTPKFATPLRFLMACANADGASAAIICSKNKLKSKGKMVTIEASSHATGTFGYDYFGHKLYDTENPSVTELSSKQVWEASGYGPEDMDVIQIYEAMSPGFLWDAEQCGFCKPGETAKLVREGYFEINGKMPANTDGGLMGRGHPTGATGLAQIIELFLQLRDEAGPRQVPGAKIAFAHCAGGGPNGVCHILKR